MYREDQMDNPSFMFSEFVEVVTALGSTTREMRERLSQAAMLAAHAVPQEKVTQLCREHAEGPRVRFHNPEAKVTRIEGKLEFSDGTSHAFSIGIDGGWQQWGAVFSEMGRSVDLLEELTQVALAEGHLVEPDNDEEDSK